RRAARDRGHRAGGGGDVIDERTDRELVDVGAIDDFPEGQMRIVDAGGRELGVARWHGRFFAAHNRCPHQGGPVCQGHLSPFLRPAEAGAPGRFEPDPERAVIACAWHGWEFDIATGESAWDAKYRIRTYPVEVENDRVLVRVRTQRG